MKNRLFLTIVLLGLLALFLIPAQPALAATITVNSILDVVADDGLCTLREAITSANTDTASGAAPGECDAGTGADTITLPAGTYTLTSGAQLPQVTTEITINGAGAVTTIVQAAAAAFDPATTWRVFVVTTTGSLTLNSMTVQHGQITTFGGGIQNTGTLILDASTVRRNSAGSGGGIRNFGGTVTIRNGSIIGGTGAGNSAGGGGGGIYNENAGQVTIDASTVSGNTAQLGGGIFNIDTGSVITIQNGSVIGGTAPGSGNTATTSGGGGIFNRDRGRVTIDASEVSGNTASIGGGIRNLTSGAVVIIQNGSTVRANTATDGGGIYNTTFGEVTIDTSTVSANTASGNGGGIYNSGSNSTVTIQDGSTVGGAGAANTATDGGGIYNNTGGQVTVDTSTVSASTASGNGGGIHNSGTLTIRNGSTIGGAGAANTATASGGGIYSQAGQVTINASTVSTNSASGGGGIYARGTLAIENGSIISGNSATTDGGGIFKDAGTATIDASTVSNNTATQGGGGIYTGGAAFTIRNGSTIGGAGAANTAAFGGGIFNNEGTVTIDASTVSANTASSQGGGIFNTFTLGPSTVSAANSCIIGNSTTAVYDNTGTTQNFANNWWGAADGPGGVGPGSGDTISINITFVPFATAPVPGVCGPFPLPGEPESEPGIVVAAEPAICNLDIDVSVKPSVVSGQGDAVKWTAVVTNRGPDTCTDVYMTGTMRDEFTILGVVSSAGISNFQAQSIDVALGDMTAGQSETVTIDTLFTRPVPYSAGAASAEAGVQYCFTGSTLGDEDAACITLFPGELPQTGSEPVRPWWPVAAAILAAGLVFGGWHLLHQYG